MPDFILGAYAGVIASIIVIFIIFLFNRYITLRLKKTLHVGQDLSGNWRANFSSEQLDFNKAELSLQQYGHEIKGRLSLIKESKENDNSKLIYGLEGLSVDRLFMARFKRTKVSTSSSGTLLLDSSLVNETLIGLICISSKLNETCSIKLDFEKC